MGEGKRKGCEAEAHHLCGWKKADCCCTKGALGEDEAGEENSLIWVNRERSISFRRGRLSSSDRTLIQT
jgi:hypothetical protein